MLNDSVRSTMMDNKVCFIMNGLASLLGRMEELNYENSKILRKNKDQSSFSMNMAVIFYRISHDRKIKSTIFVLPIKIPMWRNW